MKSSRSLPLDTNQVDYLHDADAARAAPDAIAAPLSMLHARWSKQGPEAGSLGTKEKQAVGVVDWSPVAKKG